MSASSFRFVVVASVALSAAGAAYGQEKEPDWFVHVGPGQLTLKDSAKFYVGGAAFPGAQLHTDPQWTGLIEVGKFFTDNLAVGFTFGAPPTAKADGRGAIAPYGRLAEVNYGPTALTGQYHFMRNNWIDPYLGVGATFMAIIDTTDATLKNVKAKNDLGPVIQGGAAFSFTRHWGAYVDVKKGYLSTTTTGTLGGMPVAAKILMDPLVLSTGVAYKF